MSYLSAQGQIPNSALSYDIPANLGGGGGSNTLLTQVLPIGNYVFSVSLSINEDNPNTITTGTLELLRDGVIIASNTYTTPAGTYNPNVFLSGIVVSDGTTSVSIVAGGSPGGGGGWTSLPTKLYVVRIV
jgi:hypothetical protein